MEANFPLDMVRRTAFNLANYRGKFDVTNLINCTLGLIIFPYEEVFNDAQGGFWDTPIDITSTWPSFQNIFFEPIEKVKINKKKVTFYDKKFGVLLKKIRNGLAHQNIEPINRNGYFAEVKISNFLVADGEISEDFKTTFETKGIEVTKIVRRNGHKETKFKDFEITFSREQLAELALFIASEFLKNELYIGHEYIIDPSLTRTKNKGRRCSLLEFKTSNTKRTFAKIKYLDTNRTGGNIDLWKLKAVPHQE